MAPNYVQRFLDRVNLSTTSRYLKVERQGMHATLKRFEETREFRCTSVAHDTETPTQAADPTDRQPASNSVQ